MLSTVFSDRQLRDAFLTDVGEWMLSQRWYSAKGTDAPALKVAGWVRLGDTSRRTTSFATFLASDGRRFAVPVTWTYLDEVAFADSEALISTLDTPSGRVYIADATGVDEARAMLVSGLVRSELSGEGISIHGSLTERGRALDGLRPAEVARTERLAGEQSNTSIIATLKDSSRIIVKIFRQLHEGDNPDIAIQRALQDAGNERIAPLLGFAHLTDAAGEADAALIQTFLPDVEDAWRQALVSASTGESFGGGARTLGRALAQVHSDLASALPTTPASVNTVYLTLEAMKERLARFAAEVPELEQFAAPIGEAYRGATQLAWPDFQRIHGDLHLGQVLNSPDGGWILLDFEGEPLRPMDERVRPDSPARDVAGLLRSFDYAGAYVELNEGIDAAAWVTEARTAFLDAYLEQVEAGSAEADLRELIRVFELDKAAYEAVYEARNRPEWAEIPQQALARLTAKVEED